MQIWVDADACPKVIKDILFRAAERQRIALILVANKPLHTPPSQFIRALQVPAGFDVADNHIVEQVQAGDLVITADIPLAGAGIARAPHAPNPRGEVYTTAKIRELHVYGEMAEIGKAGSVQHWCYGKKLLAKAEEIAQSNGKTKMQVTSGVGAREYYKKHGYQKEGFYMVKNL